MVILRDMRESDIENYVRWFTTETEWMHWDAPWETIEPSAPTEERTSWTEYYESVRNLPDDVVRQKFEIECDGVHVGWICAYKDLGYMENPEDIPAIGLDIPETAHRKRGCGTQAMRLYMEYLKERRGWTSFYTQTWSGNLPMLRVAEKLGFYEVERRVGLREVDGVKYDAITLRVDL